jgi:drug/metabolite transporter (DMT)-like permease
MVSVAEVQLTAGLIVVGATIFVALNAKARGMNWVGWGIGAFLFTIVAVPLYLIVRKPLRQFPEPKPNVQADHWQHPTCKVCDRGSLIQKKVFRMSGPVVAIGFFLLVPSVIGMLLCALALVQIADQPDNASGLAGGIVIAIGIACFVGGLLGWLLVMRKRVLKCSLCGAVINAS